MIWRGLVGILVGFLAHWGTYDLTERYTATPDLNRYGIGVLATFPVFLLFRRGAGKADDIEEGCLKGALAFLSAFISVGIGVLLGRLTRKMWR